MQHDSTQPEPPADEAGAQRARWAHLRHEMRAPLNRIVAVCEAALEDADAGEMCLPKALQVDLERILGCGHALLCLCDDIFCVARLESGAEIDAAVVARRLREEMRASLDTALSVCEVWLAEPGAGADGAVDKIRRALTSVSELIDGVTARAS
jgi:signal transduction histidine kinase